jgi:outer membrane protein assembly factor BamB
MTQQLSLERRLADLMDVEAAGGAPDQLVDTILAATSTTRQMPGWLAAIKEPPMTAHAQPVVGVVRRQLVLVAALGLLAAAVVIGAAAFLLLRQSPTADVWSGFRGDAGRSSAGVHGPIGNPTLAWAFRASGPIVHNISIADGLALVPSDDGVLSAVRTVDGVPMWSFRAADGVGGPLVADGRVHVFDGTGIAHALNVADGVEVWASDQPVDGPTYATRVGDHMIVGTATGDVVAIDLESGARAWQAQVSGSGAGVHSPSAGDGLVVAVADDGSFASFDASTGESRWQINIGDGTAVGTPVVANGVAYLGSASGSDTASLIAFDAATGRELWRIHEPFFSPSIVDGVAYLGSSGGTVAAVDLATRSELWRIQRDGIVRPPAIAGDMAFLPADGERRVVALDRRTGAELWSYDLGGPNDCCIAVADGLVFVGTSAGDAFAIGGDGATVTPRSPAPSTVSPTAAPSQSSETPLSSVPPLSVDVSELRGDSFGWQFPGGLDVGPDGNLYVVSQGTAEVIVVSPEGEEVRRWGEPGSESGEFEFRRDLSDPLSVAGSVAVAADGTVYVTEGGNRRVQAFTSEGKYLREWGELGDGDGQFLAPFDIDLGPDGTVYVVDDRRDDIQRFTTDGAFLGRIGRHGTEPGELNGTGGLTVGPDGTVYNADFGNNRVQAWTADGDFLWSLGAGTEPTAAFKTPIDIVLDDAGTLFVADDSRVQAFDAQRNLIGMWVPSRPFLGGMASSGRTIYVTSPFDHAIWVLTLP